MDQDKIISLFFPTVPIMIFPSTITLLCWVCHQKVYNRNLYHLMSFYFSSPTASTNIPLMRIVQSFKHTKRSGSKIIREGWMLHSTNRDTMVRKYVLMEIGLDNIAWRLSKFLLNWRNLVIFYNINSYCIHFVF